MKNSESVRKFHEAFGVKFPKTPTVPSSEDKKLALDLIAEEFAEVKESMVYGNISDAAKELADLLVVTYRAALVYGIPIDDVMHEVYKSNMSKLGRDGSPIFRDDGKILKGPDYKPADVESIIRKARTRNGQQGIQLPNPL